MNITKTKVISIVLIHLCFILSSSKIQPIFAASIQLGDEIIKKNTCIFKQVSLIGSTDVYQRKDISLLAYIRQMEMDDDLSFDFRSSIICREFDCYIDLIYSRHTSQVNPDAKYSITIDFLIVKNIIMQQLNMTGPTNSIDFEKEIKLIGSQNKQWQIMMFPNGFDKLSMTGSIKNTKMLHDNRFILKYNSLQDNILQMWPVNQHFIFYTIVLIQKGQLVFKDKFNGQQCKLYNKQCLKEKKIFPAFLSTSNQMIVPNNIQQNRQTYAFMKLQNLDDKMDQREVVSKMKFELKDSNNFYQIIYVVILAFLAQLIYQISKRYTTYKREIDKNSVDLQTLNYYKKQNESDLKTQLSLQKPEVK